MEPLDDWLRLLLKFKDDEFYYRSNSRYTTVPLVAGDVLNITWTLNVDQTSFHANVRVTPMKTCLVTAIVLLINKGLAYIAIEEEGVCELIYRKMPDVWQLYGVEGDPTLPIPEWRTEEIPIML